jgi:cytochrome c556
MGTIHSCFLELFTFHERTQTAPPYKLDGVKVVAGGAMNRRAHILGLVACLAAIATATAADDPIGERRALMRKLASAERAANSVILGKFLAEKAMTSLKTVQDRMADFPSLFPVGSETGAESKAGPAIWTSFAEFEALAAEIIAKAKDAEAAVVEGQDAFAVGWQAVSEVCNRCHRRFAPDMMIR